MIYVQVRICAHFEEKILSFLWLCKSCPSYKYCDKNKYLFIESYTHIKQNTMGQDRDYHQLCTSLGVNFPYVSKVLDDLIAGAFLNS